MEQVRIALEAEGNSRGRWPQVITLGESRSGGSRGTVTMDEDQGPDGD